MLAVPGHCKCVTECWCFALSDSGEIELPSSISLRLPPISLQQAFWNTFLVFCLGFAPCADLDERGVGVLLRLSLCQPHLVAVPSPLGNTF